MYRLAVSIRANADLDAILTYITTNLHAPKAASDFADAVAKCYDTIQQNPHIYEFVRDEHLKNQGYRRAVIKNYVMVYRVLEEREEVEIHRFFYGRMDYFGLI